MRKSSLNALFSKTRQAILSACLLHPEKEWYLSDLAQFVKMTPSTLQRELASLVSAELLLTKKEGNRVYYQFNMKWPAARELQQLFIKTAGIADVVKSALKKFSGEIIVAFIYGSYARGEALASSDIDLMIIGNLKLTDLSSQIKKLEATFNREVNPTLFTKKDFITRLRNQDGFIKTVLSEQKFFLMGSEDELKSLGG